MTWGDETLTRNNAYLFDRVDFGNGCEARCDAESETEFEFFLDRRDVGKQARVPFTWELNEVLDSTEKTVHLEGGIEAPYYQSAFVYERKCIPRSSCYEFTMGYRSNMTQSNKTEFFDPSMYSVRFD